MFTINGLIYLENYVSQQHHDWLINQIDEQPWDTSMKRRVQHYGYRYDYKARKATNDMRLGPLPSWLDRIANQLRKDGLIEYAPDQVIVNEYEPGQGISPHIDCEPCFGDRVFSLSLGSSAIMEFSLADKEGVEVMLAPKSLLMMTNEARYNWKHSIRARKKDNGIKRMRRLSLTFRKVLL